MCTDLVRRGCDLGARGHPTWPDPRERAQALQGAWQRLRASTARRGARLQAAMLVQEVVRLRMQGGPGRRVGSAPCPACPTARSTSVMRLTRPRGCGSSSRPWRARPAGGTRRPRPCCCATSDWSVACTPSGRSYGDWTSRRGRPQPKCRLPYVWDGKDPELQASSTKCTCGLSTMPPLPCPHTEGGNGRAFVAPDLGTFASGLGCPTPPQQLLIGCPSPISGILSACL